MSIPILEACKKRKRRPKLFGFHSFGDPGCPIRTTGPFRDNIRTFLQQASEVEDYNLLGMPIWCTLLVHENRSIVIPLYTIEETVEHSCRPHCDHCRCTGNSSIFLFDFEKFFLSVLGFSLAILGFFCFNLIVVLSISAICCVNFSIPGKMFVMCLSNCLCE